MADALPADLGKVDPGAAWQPWEPAGGEWTRARVAHLFRRAAFGATPAEAEQAITDGLPKTLARLLAGAPDAADKLDLLTETGQYYAAPVNLRVWWLYAMTEGGHPLREKLALFWHNHFATSYAKVRSTKLMYEQNVLLRKHALGTFRPFLLDISRDTAMLVWLDSNRNVKGAPNENYAREVMELFSLGVGNYTEKDIQEAARALTGWHHDAEVKRFEFNRDRHDPGEKTVFGKTGKWTGEDVVRLCCDQDACATFLVSKLYAFLVSEMPPPKALLAPLAAQFRKSDYDIADLVKTMLGSRLFFSQHAYRKRVKWPVEYALGAVNAAVPGRVPLADLVDPLAKMGQPLFAPPNVKGWRTGTDWLNSATLLARNNFAEKVALGEWNRNGPTNRNEVFQTEGRPVAIEEKPKADTPSAPAPEAKYDICAAVYAAGPKDVAAVVRQMGVVLYGEPVPAAQAKKLEAFLSAPPARPNSPEKPAIPPPESPVPLAVAPPPRGAKPYTPDLDSPEFKARVREAFHAMMCLPEYQLN